MNNFRSGYLSFNINFYGLKTMLNYVEIKLTQP